MRFCLLGSILALMVGAPARAGEPSAEQLEFFEKKIRPILADHCFKCHSANAKKLKGGLRLDSRQGMLTGGDTGPALVPGRPEKSRLLEAVGYQNVELQMPPNGKLPASAVADLTAWIKMGAPWPAQNAAAAAKEHGFDLQKRRREHWSWRPLQSQSPPKAKRTDWPLNPIDNFILSRLEARDLAPAPDADRRTLIRRVYFDLIGLPPTPADVDAFLIDSSPRAFETVVDRLLSSSRYGERWARHWLDLVRYGESRGHEFDYVNPNAYQYRDYVIRAFNADVPYDRFVVEHIAGDLLRHPRINPVADVNESILGTGFWFLGEQVHSPVDTCQDKADRFDNMIDVMGKTFLGLTVACARCHDHKFDAISTKDYYALFGFLESSSYRLARFESMEHNRQVAERLWKLREESRPKVQKELVASWRPGLSRVADFVMAAAEALSQGADRSEIAGRHKIEPETLARWIAALADVHNKPWRRIARQADVEVIVDYATARPEDWLPDGPAYGPRPVRPGDLCFGTDPVKPILRFIDYAAAEKDPTWDVLCLAAGSETDPGALGRLVRAGRTIRTPAFEIKSGPVYYLVKGAGQAYAAVDGHVMIEGPLHGQLVHSCKTGNEFRWVVHDLTAYKGRRTHIEFTPVNGSEFAVGQVVQGGQPPDLERGPNGALLRLIPENRNSQALAKGLQKLLLEVADLIATDRLRSSPADYAAIANWMLQHQQLFVNGMNSVVPSANQAAKAFVEAQARLVSQIHAASHLALAMMDGSGVNEHVFIRGNYKAPGQIVPRRFLEALGGEELTRTPGSGRLDLARQMIDPAIDPYLPRVMVNRIWYYLFGRGIVASVDNFGVLGEKPTHPELLDFLADRFVKDGWSVKKMIRVMVLSRSYQMSSEPTPGAEQADPENLLLHRMRLRRLEGEAIRDAMLAVSGRLEGKMFGPSVPVYLTSFQDGRGRPQSGPLDGDGRRSLYLSVRRNFLPAILLAFDTPIPFSTVGRRTVSNVPAQALILMNDPFVHQQAELWAKKELEVGGSVSEQVTRMYLNAFGRPPSTVELSACLEFVGRQAHGASETQIWTALAHVLFNAKEFVFLN